MRALAFLLVRSIKNSFLEAIKKPAKLSLYLVLLAMIVGLAIVAHLNGADEDRVLELIYLKAIFIGFAVITCGLSISKGFSSGDSFFDMSDVNLLFVSPVGSRRILIYGIVRLAKMAFLTSFFILFQSESIGNTFGIGFSGLLLLMLALMLCMGISSVIAVLIYSATNSNPRAKILAKTVFVLLLVPFVAVFATHYLETGSLTAALDFLCRSELLTWFPVIGWAASACIAVFSGAVLTGLFFFGITVLFGAALIAYLALSRTDYYEDVLVATETTFEKRRAQESGNINAAFKTDGRVKIAKMGISGIGAKAIFGKHMRESFRQSRFGFINLTSLLMMAAGLTASAFMRGSDSQMILLQVFMWMQIFFIGTGRGLREIYIHYIYLVPEPSFSKIVWCNMEAVLKTLIESLVIFGIGGIIIGESPLVIIATTIVYALFTMLLLAINFLSMRWTGANVSAGLLIAVYLLAVIISLAPGVAGAIVFYVFFGESMAGSLCILAAWELALALVYFALSRGVLHGCDMPTMPQKR